MVAVAAMLFTAPVQAQTMVKEAKKATKTFKATPSFTESQKAKMLDAWRSKLEAKAKASASKDAGIPFRPVQGLRVNNASQEEVDQKKAEIIKANSLVKTTFTGINLHANAQSWGYANQLLTGLYNTSVPRKAGAAEGEVKDANGIITTPAEGEHKFYTRSGDSYTVSNQQVTLTTQGGHVEMVECTDGTVYIKDPVSAYATNAWVKGSKAGNTITVPAKQPLAYNSNYATTLSMRWGVVNASASFSAADDHADIFTYTVDGNVISLQGTSIYDGATDNYFMGVFWDDDNSFSGYGDVSSVYTLAEGYEPASTDPIVPPTGLATETWNVKYEKQSNSGSSVVVSTANVGFVGNEVYVQGLFTDFPEAWIKGTIEGNDVTFSKFQFLGNYSSYNIWMVGVTIDEESEESTLDDFRMTYDAEAKVLTAVNDVLANAAEDRIYYLSWASGLVIQEEAFVEEAVATGEPVDVLPYTNDFANEATEQQFGVIDANSDGIKWLVYAPENGPVCYRVKYNSTLAADDWLVSPAIKLEAGKIYHFAIQAKSESSFYPERIEVKLGTEAKASVLAEGASVIAPTDVTWSAYQVMENVALSVEETGYYHFGIHGISDADCYYLSVTDFFVEVAADPNAPAAVSELTVTPKAETLGADISFKAPATTVSGAELTSNLEKIEIMRDGKVIKTFENVAPGSEVAYEDVADDLTVGMHTYQVVAYNEAGIGKKSEAIEVRLTYVIEVPYLVDFANENVLDAFEVIDLNGDGNTWAWTESYGTYYHYDSNNSADDYLVTMPIRVKAGKVYDVKVEAAAYSNRYPERFEVVAGAAATAEGLNVEVIPATDLTSTEPTEYAGSFTAQADGVMYVAIHAISDPDRYNLILKSLSIESPEPLAPAAPVLTVTPDAQGALNAEVEVTAPTTCINGDALTGNVKIEVQRDGVVVKTFESVAPGAGLSFTDNVEDNAVYNYRAFTSNTIGAGKPSEKVVVFIGLDIPLAPENFANTTTANSVLFSWDAAVAGENGGLVQPVKYNLYNVTVTQGIFGPTPTLDEEPFAQTEATNYTLENYDVDEGDQGYTYFAIRSENSRGEGEDYNLTAVFVGAPYELPVIEGFANNSLHYFWNTDNAELFISGESSDGDGTALMLVNMEDAEAPSAVISGKLNLANATNPTLVFDVKTESSASSLLILGKKSAEEFQLVSNYIPMAKEYSTVKVPLKDIQDDRFSQIAFYAQMPNLTTEEYDYSTDQYFYSFGDSIVIDNIRVVDLLKYDVQVKSINAPKKVDAGSDINVAYTVENIGEDPATDVVVKLFYKDNNENRDEVVVKADTVSLASFESKDFAFTVPTTVFTGTEAEFRVVATFANDLNNENNEYGTVVEVKQSTLPAPTDVVLETADLTNANSATISWTAPEPISSMFAAAAVTEDVESFDDDENGGLDANVHSGQIGDWTVVDGNNGLSGYGFSGIETSLGNPGSWMVFNPSKYGIEENYAAHSGEKYFISSCVAEPQGSIEDTDNWLISPELSGFAQTISFYTRELVATYGAEKFEILASSTDKNIESFTLVASKTASTTEWEEVSVDLPAGTKYFAIRHISNDVWAMLIDDITYIPAGGGGSGVSVSSTVLTGYNIYVDHDFTVNAKASQTETTFPHRFKGTEKIFVTAVYNLIDEAMPNLAEQRESAPVQAIGSVTAIEEILVKSGKNVNIYTMDGKLVRSNSGLRKGVYVVDGKKVVK
jgi:hypothetical protein